MALYPDFKRLYGREAPATGSVIWLPFLDGNVVVGGSGNGYRLLTEAPQLSLTEAPLLLGHRSVAAYVTCELPTAATLPTGQRAVDLRTLHGYIDELDWAIAGYAAHILHWRRTSGYCPVCGAEMGPLQAEWMRECTRCAHQRYPQVSPAVLALVHDGGDRVLLAHKPGWGQRYSIPAGFVLPGESLEECVHREVEEEVGVRVTDLVYQGSQPWPFPHQLMVGFSARFVSGEIRLDEQELDHAAWFDVHDLPPLPPVLSLSRQMLDSWTNKRMAAESSDVRPQNHGLST